MRFELYNKAILLKPETTKAIRQCLTIPNPAEDSPPPECGPDDLTVHCWEFYEQVDLLMGLTGATTMGVDR
jgi:hypothetical protein